MKNLFPKFVSGMAVLSMILSVATPVLAAHVNNNPTPDSNPALGQACGLDIALVLDVSGSVGSAGLSQMKTAYAGASGFVNTLSTTPTQFSVTKFSTTATVLQNFTGNASAVNAVVNAIPSVGGATNWEAGLIKAASTLPNRSNPNLIIFASDGQPNKHGNNVGPGTNFDQASLNAAVTEANTIKASGTRIITLGVGSSVTQSNLEAISSGDAYYSASDYSTIASTLQSIATDLCGGTLTVTKTVNSGAPKAGWVFTVNGNDYSTDVNGQTVAIPLDGGTYSVTETSGPVGAADYTLNSASCSTGETNNGTASGNGVSGVVMGNNDIVSCAFDNTVSISGCMDETATNFNSDANISDPASCTYPTDACPFVTGMQTEGPCASDSCELPTVWNQETQSCQTPTDNPVLGCMDSTATNYNPLATQDDGSCIPPVLGCTDSTATNYNSDATVGNDEAASCTYPVLGCTDETADNYNPLATQDDGSCTVPAVLGCTDSNATNYNEAATQDDGSCTYTDVCPNIEGNQSSIPDGDQLNSDNQCVPVTAPTDVCPNIAGNQSSVPAGKHKNSQGNCVSNTSSGGSSGGSRIPQGEVLGAETDICHWDVNTYMRKGYANDASQVKILQNDLLNGVMKAGLAVDGVYGPMTEAAVNAFQVSHKDHILTPWNLTSPTGIFYKTTLVEAKNTICPTAILPVPTDLVNWSDNAAQVPAPVAH